MFTEEQRRVIFDKTKGLCYYCEKGLSFLNRDRSSRGAWEIEHRLARANGGTNHGNNLVAACWPCNLGKGTMRSRTHRLAVASERAARTSRRLWRSAGRALVPALVVAAAAFAYLKWNEPSEDEKRLMSKEDRDNLFWKAILIPIGLGLATLAIIVVIGEMTRKAAA